MKKIMTVILSVLMVLTSLTSVFIAPVSAAANLWNAISANDWYTRQVHTQVSDPLTLEEKKMTDVYPEKFTYGGGSFSLKDAGSKHYYIKLPKLALDKTYKLSFNYDITEVSGKTPVFHKAILMPESAFSNSVTWNGFGDMYTGRGFLGAYDIFVNKNIASNEMSATVTYEFNSKKQTQYYLFLAFNNITDVTYSGFKLVDPTDTTPDEEEQNPADVWTNVSMDDWRTRHVHSPADDGRNIPEKSMTENYGSDFTYDAANNSFTLANAHGRHYLVKMPKLTKNKNYKLLVNYSVNPGANAEPMFYKSLLVPESAFTSEYCWNKYGEIYADRSWIGIQNVLIQKSLKDANSGTLTYDFNTGKYDQYHLFLMFNNIESVTYSNFRIIDPELQVDYESSPLNYGSVSPAALAEGTKAGDKVEFTATPFKGNTFEGWYSEGGELLSTDPTFTYTVPTSLAMPKPKFKEGSIAVENASMEDSTKGLLAYYSKNDNFNKVILDENFDVEYIGTPSWEVNIQAHNQHARTGNMSVKIQTQYAFAGRHFKGLEKNTDYAISFWAYIQDDSGLSLNAMVLPKGVKPYKENAAGKLADYPLGEAMGVAEKAATATSSWQEVVVRFNSGDNTDITLWFLSRGANSDRCWVDDFAIFKPAALDVVSDLGGKVKATAQGLLAKGTEVTVTATPDKGNNFKHWLDKNGMVVSTEAEYTFTLEEDTYLKAVYGGYNKPARELFALRGDDGTFEKGTISGIYPSDATYPDSLAFCKTSVSTAEAYEGEKSLEIISYYRNTVIPLTGLNKNTDYKFSYYVKYPYNGERSDWNQINSMMIVGSDDIDGATANKVFAESTSYLAGDAGWYKVDLYFNTGDDVAANFIIRYAGEPNLEPKVYMDNVTLYEYYSANELSNGSMTNDIAPWLGNGEIENNTLKLSGKDTTAYQLLGLDAHSRYTVKFRAKGNFFASVSDVSAKVPNVHNAISSESYVTGNSTSFKEYKFEVYTGVHKGVGVFFSSLGGDVFIDDVTVTKELSSIGGVIENIDFETDRFALTHTNTDFYEIYTAKSAKDPNVHSGKKSLHFKYNAQRADVEAILDEAYLSYGVAYNHNYMLSLYYKFDTKTKEAAVNLEPNFRASYYGGDYGDYTGETGYKQPTTNGEWKRVYFVFTAGDFGVLKAAIYNLIGRTDADFYVDDIKITVSSDLVVDEKAEKAYATDFYNMFTNPSFEKKLSEGNWTALPPTMQIVKNPDLADTSDSFLKVAEGTKYVLPIQLNPSEVYYFGASIKSINGGKGRIYLATLVEPTTLYFTDLENNPKSIVEADSAEWKHEGFGFRASPTGETYLVIECTDGAIGLDTVSLTAELHAQNADYNYYYPHIPFDYDNIDPAMIVYNGGVDIEYGSTSPSTGDSITVVSIVAITCLVAFAAIMLTKKGKDETDA